MKHVLKHVTKQTSAHATKRVVQPSMRDDAPNVNGLGARALAAMGSNARAVPVIVLHGDANKVVSIANARATVVQFNAVNASHSERHGAAIFPDALRWLWRDFRRSLYSTDEKRGLHRTPLQHRNATLRHAR